MTDQDLELLRAWDPEPVTASHEVREDARARLEQEYGASHAPAAGRRFGKRVAIAALAAAVLIAGAIVFVQREVDDRVDSIKTVTVPNGSLNGGEVGHGPVNILIVGSDLRDGTNPEAFGTPAETGPARSDTMILLRIDGTKVRGLWLPRDLVMPSTGDRINASFNHGPQGLIDAIKTDLGVEIDHYVEINFAGFTKIVDELGGVPMYSPGHVRDAFSGLDLPAAGCRTFTGAEALAWVRARHLEVEQNGIWVDASPRADLDRSARQQQFVRELALRAKSVVADDPTAAVGLVDAIVPALKIDSDFTKSEILGLVRAIIDIDPGTAVFSTLPVQSAPDGARVVRRDPDAETALAPFKGGPTPDGPPPADAITDSFPVLPPSPDC